MIIATDVVSKFLTTLIMDKNISVEFKKCLLKELEMKEEEKEKIIKLLDQIPKNG